MNAPKRSDPLLRGTRLLLVLAMALAALTGLALIVAAPSIWIFGERIIARAAESGVVIEGNQALAAISAIIAFGLVFVGMVIQILRKLIALIDSLEFGSPFIPENARRLRAMGWLVLAMQGLALLAAPAAIWMRHLIPVEYIHTEFSFSLAGLLMAALLFILARVFDHGVRLEQDVEGTV